MQTGGLKVIKRWQNRRGELWILAILGIGLCSCDSEPAGINDHVETIPKDSLNPHISDDMLLGQWEHVGLEQITTKNRSVRIALNGEGSNGQIAGSRWGYSGDLLTLNFEDAPVYECRVSYEWDWENEIPTLVYTGMNSEGICVWEKKL